MVTGLVIWLKFWLYGYWFGYMVTVTVIWLQVGYMLTGSVI